MADKARDEYARAIADEASAQANGNDPIANAEANPNGQVSNGIGTAFGNIPVPSSLSRAWNNDVGVHAAQDAWQGAKDATKNDLVLGENGVLGLRKPAIRGYNDMQNNLSAANSALERGNAGPVSPTSPPLSAAGGGVVRAQPMPQQQGQQGAPGGAGPAMGALNSTYATQEQGIRDQTAAAVSANNAQSSGDARVAGIQSAQAAESEKRAQDQANQSARQLDEVHRLSDAAATMKVDPDHFWHSQGAGQRVAYTIAAALGGFAAGWTHGPNVALEQINRNIDQDISAQRMAIEQAHGKVADAKGILGEMYTRFGNLDKAESATKLLQINSAINQTKAQVASANSPSIAANAQILIPTLEREKILQQQRFMAAGQKGPDFNKMHELSKDLEADRSVAGEQALNNLGQMDKTGQGDIPGTSLGGRILGSLAEPDEHGHRGFIAGLANAARGSEARQASGAMYQAAEASLPPSIRGSPEAVKNQMAALFGSGSAEDVRAGMDRARSLIGGQRANAYAGQDPKTVADYEALDHAYGRRSAAKAGLPPGSTP